MEEKEKASAAEEAEAGEVNPRLLEFLDADTYERKLDVLAQMRMELTDQLIDTMAASLDVVIDDGSLEKRFDDLRYVLLTRKRYEVRDRLR